MTAMFRYKDASNTDPHCAVFDLADGRQAMVQVFSDRQIHLMFRNDTWHTWDVGYWSVLSGWSW